MLNLVEIFDTVAYFQDSLAYQVFCGIVSAGTYRTRLFRL
jgi:hypothetical protein